MTRSRVLAESQNKGPKQNTVPFCSQCLLFLFRSSKLWKQAHDRVNGLNHRNSYY